MEGSSLMVCFSAPCRLDVGGSWDMPSFAVLFPHVLPTTVTTALDMRVKVAIEYTDKGGIILNNNGVEEYINSKDKFNFSVDNFVLAILSHFDITDGIRIKILNEFPLRSGLGGSGALAVCLIQCIYKLLCNNSRSIIQTAHLIENACSVYTGLQDQCAAVYGGIYQWLWDYSTTTWYEQKDLFVDYDEFTKLLLVVYTGTPHFSADINDLQIKTFYNPATRSKWFDININTHKYAEALRSKDWLLAGKLISIENLIRNNLVPIRCSPFAKRLQDAVIDLPCGFGIAGAGKGGCVFVLGESQKVTEEVRTIFSKIILEVPTARFLNSSISFQGIKEDTF